MRRSVVPIAVAATAVAGLLAAGVARAGGAEHPLPENGDAVVGVVTTAFAQQEDTLLDAGAGTAWATRRSSLPTPAWTRGCRARGPRS